VKLDRLILPAAGSPYNEGAGRRLLDINLMIADEAASSAQSRRAAGLSGILISDHPFMAGLFWSLGA